LRGQGYTVQIFYLWVPSVDLSLARVRSRVAQGGHGVPEGVVRRRFDRSIKNFLRVYRNVADAWVLFDNSATTPAIIAFEKQGKLNIIDRELYATVLGRSGAP
jgi:predicted ABC-type ATPase